MRVSAAVAGNATTYSATPRSVRVSTAAGMGIAGVTFTGIGSASVAFIGVALVGLALVGLGLAFIGVAAVGLAIVGVAFTVRLSGVAFGLRSRRLGRTRGFADRDPAALELRAPVGRRVRVGSSVARNRSSSCRGAARAYRRRSA